MIKKLVLFVMLMMCVGAISAQERWSLTPEIGMTAINRGGGRLMNAQAWNARWKIGVGVEYGIKPGFFSLKSGLFYTQRGSTDAYLTSYGPSNGTYEYGTVSVETNRHFLQVPVLANFSFKLAEHVKLNLAAGPYIAYSLGDKYSANMDFYSPSEDYGYGGYGYCDGYWYGQGWQSTGYRTKGVSHNNPFDWGLSFQVGLEVHNWVINAGYDASLGKEFAGGPTDMKYNTFSLSVGYKFKLGK